MGCLRAHYGLEAASIERATPGLDFYAAAYKVTLADGTLRFLKARRNGVRLPALRVCAALGLESVLPPIRTREGELWCQCGDEALVLFPFVEEQEGPPSGQQWIELGKAVRAIHAARLEPAVLEGVRQEQFALPSASALRKVIEDCLRGPLDTPAKQTMGRYLSKKEAPLRQLVEHTESLGKTVRAKRVPAVVCHADLHLGNVLFSKESVYVIDWEDGPILAPKERDLIFFVNTRLGEIRNPDHEALFLQGYGVPEIDREALEYFWCERAIEDLAVNGEAVLQGEMDEEKKQTIAIEATTIYAPDTMLSHFDG